MSGQDAMLQMQQLQQALQVSERRLAVLEQNLVELGQALEAMKAVAAGIDGPVMLPLGAGLQVRAQIVADAPVLRPVGADTFVDGSADDAVGHLEARIAEVRSAITKSNQDYQELMQHASQVQAAAQAQADQ